MLLILVLPLLLWLDKCAGMDVTALEYIDSSSSHGMQVTPHQAPLGSMRCARLPLQ
jgi:hypothetical protein